MENRENSDGTTGLKKFAENIYKEKYNIELSCFNNYCSENILVIDERDQIKSLSLIHAVNNIVFRCLEAERNRESSLSYIKCNIFPLIDVQAIVSQNGPDEINMYNMMRISSITVACIFSVLILILISGVNVMGMKCYSYFFSTMELILAPSIEVNFVSYFFQFDVISNFNKNKKNLRAFAIILSVFQILS